MQDNRIKISPKDVLAFLADGKTREEIREHYGLSKSDMKRVFEHPDLKGRKTKKAPGFVFEEDSPSEEIFNRDNEINAGENESLSEQNSIESTETQSEEQIVTETGSQWVN